MIDDQAGKWINPKPRTPPIEAGAKCVPSVPAALSGTDGGHLSYVSFAFNIGAAVYILYTHRVSSRYGEL